MRLRMMKLISLIGLIACLLLWGASYWNWEHTLVTRQVALTGGDVVYREFDNPFPITEQGWKFHGWRFWPQTQWWPLRARVLTHSWVVVPLWMPTLALAVLYYGTSCILFVRGYRREQAGRCPDCGMAVDDVVISCPRCRAVVNLHSVSRRPLMSAAIHALVVVSVLTSASYWHYAWALNNGTVISLSSGSIVASWKSKNPAVGTPAPIVPFGQPASPPLPKPTIPIRTWSVSDTVKFFDSLRPDTLSAETSDLVDVMQDPILPAPEPASPAQPQPTIPVRPWSIADSEKFWNSLEPATPSLPMALPRTTWPVLAAGAMKQQTACKEFVGFKDWSTNWLPRIGPSSSLLPGKPARSPLFVGGTMIIVPLWIPLMLSSYVVWRFTLSPANRRHRRQKLGLCLTCGYDLRGQVEPRCPECGVEFDGASLNHGDAGKADAGQVPPATALRESGWS